jgi:hypothetical protein
MKYALGNMLNGAGGLNPDGLSLDLQFATDKTLTARKGPTPVFTRSQVSPTGSTYVGSDGLIKYADADVARFDHDPITLVCKGLLIEEQRQNFILRSDDFSNSSWLKLASSVSNSPVSSPSGSTASRILMSSGSSQYPLYGTSYSSVLNRVVTATAYVRYANARWLWIRGDDGLSSATCWASFDIQNKIIGGSLAGITSHSIADVGSGWVRVSLTYTELAASGSNRNLVFRVGNASTPTDLPTTQIGTESFDLWGAQLEAGAFATSYIPTTTTALIRVADVCSITGANFTGMYNASEGTMLVNAFTPANGDRTVFAADDNTANEMIRLRTEGTNPFFKVTDGGSDLVAIDSGTVIANTAFKLAGAYKVNDFASVINGGTVGTDVAGTIPTVDRMRIGAGQAGNTMCGCILSLRYYKKRLSNAKLQSLTA